MANKNIIIAEFCSTESTCTYPCAVSKKWFLNNKGKTIRKHDYVLRKHTDFTLKKKGK